MDKKTTLSNDDIERVKEHVARLREQIKKISVPKNDELSFEQVAND